MRVWVMQGTYDGQLFSSVHMTEKGCALACVADVLEFHGIDNEEDALRVMDIYGEEDTEQTEPFEWDHEKLKKMGSKELWKIFQDWCEISWDIMSDRSYYIDGVPMEIQG